MFGYVFEKLGHWFETAERRRCEAFLASSVDITDLEKRIRVLETQGYSL
jgi:hypothetical protein